MRDAHELEALLRRIDGRPYPAWRDASGAWDLGHGVCLWIDRVQGDPFAAPSRVRVVVPSDLPDDLVADRDGREAAEDWLLRRFRHALPQGRRGSGKSGLLEVLAPGPEVVARSAVRVRPDGFIEARFRAGLPARGRRVLGRAGADMLLGDVPEASRALRDGPGLAEHVRSVRRQRALRRALAAHGLVAFIEDGAVLPRASGVAEGPMPQAVPSQAPDAFRVTLTTPWGDATGWGIPRGVTVLTGGGFHGKSTVLQALAHGVFDVVPGDGREGVVCDGNALKVRAEDGRAVHGVDISAFLQNLPGGRDTHAFFTEDASGSTSQAAAIVEGVCAGARVLLIDEDTSATNLLVRDARMQQLIPADQEPITPFVTRVRQLFDAWGVSTILVVGGVGDYLGVADQVFAMRAYVPVDVTARAKALAGPVAAPPGELPKLSSRVLDPEGVRIDRVRARDGRAVSLDKRDLDLTAVACVRAAAEARTLGDVIAWLGHAGLIDGCRTLAEVLDAMDTLFDKEGVEVVAEGRAPPGDLVRPRRHEVAAALSRWRGLRLVSR